MCQPLAGDRAYQLGEELHFHLLLISPFQEKKLTRNLPGISEKMSAGSRKQQQSSLNTFARATMVHSKRQESVFFLCLAWPTLTDHRAAIEHPLTSDKVSGGIPTSHRSFQDHTQCASTKKTPLIFGYIFNGVYTFRMVEM